MDLIPEAAIIVVSYLRDHPAITALGARVVPGTPSSTSAPWVRLTQLDARNVSGSSRHEHLVSCMLDLGCYSGRDGDQELASLLVRTVRAALVAMPGRHDDVVVTRVAFTGGMPHLPDQDFEPAMERYLLTAIVHMHPA